MLIPTRILAEDFQTYPVLDLALANQGLVLITGENGKTRAADNNGAGKTTIFRAIRWVLFGELDDGKADDVVRYGQKSTVGELQACEADDPSRVWRFVRTRKSKKPTFDIFPPGETDPMPGSPAELAEEVVRLFGFDSRTFSATVYYAQGDQRRFASSAVKDTERKAILHRVLGSERLRDAEKRCRTEVGEIDKRIGALEADVRRIEAQAAEHDVDGLEKRAESWEADREKRRAAALTDAREAVAEVKRFAELAGDVPGLEDDLASVDEDIEKAEAASKRLVELDEELVDAREKKAEAGSSRRECAGKLEDVRARLEDLADDVCPTCESPIEAGSKAGATKAALEADEVALKADVKAAKAKLAKAEAKVERLEAERRKVRVEADKLGEYRRERDDIVERLAEARAADDNRAAAKVIAEKATARAKAIATETNPHTDDLEKARARKAELEAELEGLGEKLEAERREREHWSFWVTGFGNKGLPSYLLDRAMPELTDRTNVYLRTLTDGDITVEFSTTAEKAKGGLTDEITIYTEIEGFPDVVPSGGQRKKIELAADLALMDLAARGTPRVPMLLLDECFDGLDATSAARVMKLLQELRERFGSIFVVTHDDDLGEEFERVVRAVRDANGDTTLEVVA